MKNSLYVKLLISYLIFGILATIVLCTFSQHMTVRHLTMSEEQRLYREATVIANGYAANYFNAGMSVEDLQEQLEIVSAYTSAEIWILDGYGHLFLNSSDRTIIEDTDAFLSNQDSTDTTHVMIEGFDIQDFGNRYYQIGTFYDNFVEETLTVFSPITIGYQVRGYVLIHRPISQITQDTNSYMNIIFATIGIVFACSFIILFAFTIFVYRPMRQIGKVAAGYAKGEFEKKIDIHTNDEVGSLANTLDYMATELATQEEDQRKFVSNVSHDFRSPLTSIKGYVEAMIDGTIPVEMQDKYLNIILFETERLNKLTQSLLDLNRFGQHSIMLDITDFDINQMIRTTILTFEGTCGKKGITFDLLLTGQELLVTADMSKIQQVLYNLVDNAVKFSHNNSDITIETSIKNEKVFVSVKDTGIGIPADSIKKIWTRFYKTDLSRGKDKRGTGLGLSIVKEIIQAHKQNINVVSTEGVGTEFIFTLPLSSEDTQ